jgi:hypothetical protein
MSLDKDCLDNNRDADSDNMLIIDGPIYSEVPERNLSTGFSDDSGFSSDGCFSNPSISDIQPKIIELDKCERDVGKNKDRKLTRFDLEEFIMEKVRASISNQPIPGDLKSRMDSNQKALTDMQQKIADLSHQLKNRNLLLKKLDENGEDAETLVKTKRDVGIQVWATETENDLALMPPPPVPTKDYANHPRSSKQ